MKIFNKTSLLLSLLLPVFLVSCKSDDPNYLWLLALAPNSSASTPASSQPQAFDMQVAASGNPADILNSGQHTVDVVVLNPNSLTDAQVILSDASKNSVLFSVVPQANGNLNGSFTVDPNTNFIAVDAYYNGQHLSYTLDITNVNRLTITLLFVSADFSATPPSNTPVDSDKDGIPDNLDAYPNDSTRSSIVKFPANSEYSTVAYEAHKNRGNAWGLHDEDRHGKNDDHRKDGRGFLHAAGADFNDYVAQVSGEVDLNAQGKVVRLRMNVQHVAGGALHQVDADDNDDNNSNDDDRRYHHRHHRHHNGSNEHKGNRCSGDHEKDNKSDGYYLKVNLPVSASYTMERFMPASSVVSSSGTVADIQSFELLPSSYETIASSNTKAGDVYAPGMTSRVEFIMNNPVELADLGSFPYDLYISYKKGKREIHFPGYVFDDDGVDPYIASNGFRWVLNIEGSWLWPLEQVNIHSAYPGFGGWYTSSGAQNLDWYLNPVIGLVYSR